MSQRSPEMQTLMETAHEALGRFLADEDGGAGEADIANVLKFCHFFTKKLAEDGYAIEGDPDTAVQYSMCAKRGPAVPPERRTASMA